MAEDTEVKERILQQAAVMFYQYGFCKVTMDEIAQNLGISKKTLYKYYEGKEHLLNCMVDDNQCGIQNFFEEVWKDSSLEFIQKLKKIMQFIGSQSAKLRGPLLEDLRKNNPEIWTKIDTFRKQHVLEKFGKLIQEGINAGVFREDININIVVTIYIQAVQAMLTPEFISQVPYSANQIFDVIIKTVFEGIFTEEGRAKYLIEESI